MELHPIGAVLWLAFAIMVWSGSRRVATLGMLAGVMYITQGQAIFLAGFNIFPTRLLSLVAFVRVWKKKEFDFSEVTKLDKLLFCLSTYTLVLYLIRTREGWGYQVGSATDAILTYFACRGLIQDFEDFDWVLKKFIILAVPFVAILWVERTTGRNLFDFMGGLMVGYYNRNGHPRCMGSFRHPSLMGSVGGTFLAMYIAQVVRKKDLRSTWIGIAACLGMIVASNSGGPVNAAAAGLVAWAIWKFRPQMRAVRWTILVLLIFLASVMKAPIYYLPAKVSAITGGGGYHRSYLIEMAIKDFGKWAFDGIELTETADWFPYVLEATGGADMTNYFLSYGVRGGIGASVLLLWLVIEAYSKLGSALAVCRGPAGDRNKELVLWGMGAVMTAHLFNWFGISYWDQFYVIWYMHLAMMGSLSQAVLNPKPQELTEQVEARQGPGREDFEGGAEPTFVR